jgi:hypothetical protein
MLEMHIGEDHGFDIVRIVFRLAVRQVSWFGKKSDEPRRVPFESLNYRAQQERRAETNPVLAQRLIDEDRYNRENIDNGLY